MKLSNLKLSKSNPRTISKAALQELANSIKEFPKMMELRPIVYDEKMVIQAGEQRYKALKLLGYKEIPEEWTKPAEGFTPEQLEKFRVLDNLHAGKWDAGKLDEWSAGVVDAWSNFKDDEIPREAFAPTLDPIVSSTVVTASDIENAKGAGQIESHQNLVEVICPHCGETFKVSI